MRRHLLAVSSALILGALTTVAVAWAFAGPARQRNWVPQEAGLTADRGPCWYLAAFQGVGFHLEVGWAVFDTDWFLGTRALSQRARDSSYAPEIRVLGDSAAWSQEHRRPPDGRDDCLVSIVDRCGWPWPALRRRIRHDLVGKIQGLDARLGASEWDWLQWQPLERRDLLARVSPPKTVIWAGFLLDSLVFTLAWTALYAVVRILAALTPRASVRRRTALAGLLLAAGLVVTVAVAWSCALLVDVGARPSANIATATRFGLVTLRRHDAPGITRIEYVYNAATMGSFLGRFDTEPGPPLWADALIEAGGADRTVVIDGCGWPFRALRCAHQLPPGLPTSPWSWARPRSSGLPLTGPASGIRASVADLPIEPIWLGLAADTVVYALAGLLALVSMRAPWSIMRARRRRRRRCLKCNYDLRGAGHARCPECGAAPS